MVTIEDNGESLRKCEWCGKSEISPTWSGKKALYCSFRCSAAGSYRMYSVVATIFTIMTSMVIISFMMIQMGSSAEPSALLILIFPQIFLAGLCIWAIYGAYIGRSMRKEGETSQ